MAALVGGGALCAMLLIGAYREARREALENLIAQETTLAQQAAKSIQENFLQAKGLAWSVAQNNHVIRMDAEGKQYLKSVLRENPREVLAITRLSATGDILYSMPDNSVAGRNIADQRHVAQVLATHSPTVSDVFTSVQGFQAVALHIPVFQGEVFQGTLAFLLSFDTIARRHLKDLRVAETGYAFLYSQQGVLLYTPVPGLAGKSHLEVTEGFPALRHTIERMLKGEAGTATFTFNRVRDQDVGPAVKHAVFLPIKLGNTFWSVCVATPESEILHSIWRFGLYLVPLGTLVLLFTALGVGLGLRHFVQDREIALRRKTEAALRESEERYRSVIENISDVYYRTDAEGRLTMLSPSGAALLGYESSEMLLGSPIEMFWRNPVERGELMAAMRTQGSVREFAVELVDKAGRSVQVATSSNFYRDKDDNIAGVEGTFRDVGQRNHDRAALTESVRRFHSLFDHMAEGVVFYSFVRSDSGRIVDYRIEEVNHSFEAIVGVRAKDVEQKRITEAFNVDQPPFLHEYIQVAATGQPIQLEFFASSRGKHVSISVAPLGQNGVAAIFQDITERKQMEEQLRFRALHDPLTGLANRTLCLDRIALAGERALRRPGLTYAVVFIDLDRFKIINDSLGHEAGDLLLREVANRLLACTRRLDTVCRYGGDEFALVLEELSAREVLRTLRRIRESLKNPVSIGGHSIQVEGSFGVAYPPAEPIGPEDILRNANIALHRAKHLGRNRVVVYKPSMHEAAIEVMSLENDIRRGLSKHEFSLLYQPTFDLAAKRLRGFEALLRWRHPSRGSVSPVEFIPVAEESGSIFGLGSFALERACSEMAAFISRHPWADELVMSVNLSPRQFSRQGLAEQIDRALSATGLPPQSLMLEITESSIMKHPEASANILARLKERGVRIAIDDFGTGYSSLSALQHLPLDYLKIDRSFISRINERAEDREIVRAIVTLAKSLHLKTIAEGIETEAQRQVLQDLGCDLGQGFLCSQAVPLEEASHAVNAAVCQPPDNIARA